MAMDQLALDFSAPVTTAPTGLLCIYGQAGDGWTGPHHCAECARATVEAKAWCEAEIAAGRYDVNLYTPAEAKAAKAKGAYRAWRG